MTRQFRYVYYNRGVSPLTLFGLGLMAVAAFVLTLPLFLGALAVFGATAGYLMWRVRKAVRTIERDCTAHYADRLSDTDTLTIDVTPDRDGREGR